MFSETYPVCYRDRFGEVATTLHNDGEELHMTLRGVEFTGRTLDDWEAHRSVDPAQLQQFILNGRELCDFVLEFAMPLPIFFRKSNYQARFVFTLRSEYPLRMEQLIEKFYSSNSMLQITVSEPESPCALAVGSRH